MITAEEILDKIDNKVEFGYADMYRLTCGYNGYVANVKVVDEYKIERRGECCKQCKTIIKVCDRYFVIYWQEELMAFDRDEYEQPVEIFNKKHDEFAHEYYEILNKMKKER